MKKRLVARAVSGFLSLSMVAAVYAAPAVTPDKPKPNKGMLNAKKVMKSKFERDKKMLDVRKQAHAKRHQAQGVK
jgi:hypothetical protein